MSKKQGGGSGSTVSGTAGVSGGGAGGADGSGAVGSTHDVWPLIDGKFWLGAFPPFVQTYGPTLAESKDDADAAGAGETTSAARLSPMERIELRQWCVEQTTALVGESQEHEFVAVAQAIFDWVTETKPARAPK